MSWMTASPTWEYPAMEYLIPPWRRWGAAKGLHTLMPGLNSLLDLLFEWFCQCFNRISSTSIDFPESGWGQWSGCCWAIRWCLHFYLKVNRTNGGLWFKQNWRFETRIIVYVNVSILLWLQMELCQPEFAAIMHLGTTRAAWSPSLRTTLTLTILKVTQVELHYPSCSAMIA